MLATADGRGVSDCACTCPPIAKVRMQIVPAGGGGDVCGDRSACEFSCGRQTGATQFDIPPGRYQISLVPVGPDGVDVTGGEAGACRAGARAFTKLYDVVKGQVTQLDALQLVVGCAPECGGDTSSICKR